MKGRTESVPFKDPGRMREYMRERRAAGKVNKVNQSTLTVNHEEANYSLITVSGEYESGYWTGICPACNCHNKMDPKRIFTPVESCEHLIRLVESGKASSFIFKGRLTVKVNVNPAINPVNSKEKSYLLSYSCNKYQFVLYSIDNVGNRSFMKSCTKGEVLNFGKVKITLTWGPDDLQTTAQTQS